jgi:hypothetical protein
MAQGAGSATFDACGVWVEADTKERVALFRERAQAFEVAHRQLKS